MPSNLRTLAVSMFVVMSLAACGSGTQSTVPAVASNASASSFSENPPASVTSSTVPQTRVAGELRSAGAVMLTPPAGSIYLGALVNPTPSVPATTAVRVAAFEAQIGRTLALDDHYYGWKTRFPGSQEADDLAHNRIPVIAWNCAYSNASVAAGAHDADIIAAAANIKAYGHPLFLRWFWEMDLSQNTNSRTACWDAATDLPGGYFNPVHFVAAWQHIRAIFAAEQVTNVVWLWNPSTLYSHKPSSLAPYYPGDAATDWIGIDAYGLNPGESFAQTFSPMYATVTGLTNKPMLVAETATIASNQTAWLTGADATLATQFPNIKGLMYFDSPGTRSGWTLTTTGMSQFKTVANSAYLAAVPKL